MRRERVADDIYVFTSELYAQVTAGVINTPQGVILVDTMVYPEEIKTIKRFVEDRLNSKVRYIINTHYHADHTYGNCFFESAVIIGHALCYDLMNTRGREGLTATQQNSSLFDEITIIPPHVLFDKSYLEVRLGSKTLLLRHSPGHSPDSITVYAREDRVLFAGDTLMPVPYFVDGDYDDFITSLHTLKGESYENIVQGHGEIILRGEIDAKINEDLTYLADIRNHVKQALTMPDPETYLRELTVEEFGKNRILLNGGVEQLHQNNLTVLYDQLANTNKAR